MLQSFPSEQFGWATLGLNGKDVEWVQRLCHDNARVLIRQATSGRETRYCLLSRNDPDSQAVGWIPAGEVLDKELQNVTKGWLGFHPQSTANKKVFVVYFDIEQAPKASKAETVSTTEGTIMKRLIDSNKTAIVSAAYLEAGRIANNQIIALVAPKLPLMARGYAETPIGKLVIANLTNEAITQFRPQDEKLRKLGAAMLTQAHSEALQTLNIEGMINDLLKSPGIQSAIDKLDGLTKSAEATE